MLYQFSIIPGVFIDAGFMSPSRWFITDVGFETAHLIRDLERHSESLHHYSNYDTKRAYNHSLHEKLRL
jgi:hypothetical protein